MKPLPFKIQVQKRKIVIFVVGRAKSGKSFLSRLIAEVAGLVTHPQVLLIDCDEVADRDFSRWKSKHVRTMPLKSRMDIAKLGGVMSPDCRLVLADLAGASQGFMESICEDRQLLAEHGIEIVPVVITTDYAELSELTIRWLDIFKHSGKGFLILNQHQKNPNIKPLSQLPVDATAPGIVHIMHVPPLDTDVANEIARLACSIGDVVEGEIDTKRSDILALGLYQTAAGLWANDAVSNLAALFAYIDSVIDDSADPQTGLPPSDIAVPAKATATKKATA